jgi:hypothetical protein
MQVYRIETTLSKDGKLSIKGLPFRKGDSVEVIVLSQSRKPTGERYPLRGKLISYNEPFTSVAEDDWDALK